MKNVHDDTHDGWKKFDSGRPLEECKTQEQRLAWLAAAHRAAQLNQTLSWDEVDEDRWRRTHCGW